MPRQRRLLNNITKSIAVNANSTSFSGAIIPNIGARGEFFSSHGLKEEGTPLSVLKTLRLPE